MFKKENNNNNKMKFVLNKNKGTASKNNSR